MSILDTLAAPVAFVLKSIHEGLSTFLDPASGWAWGLSIVFLTITVRIALFPLFVKQIKSQRRMQEIAPKMKELQVKHKGDRETLNVELMKLYKEHGTNPVSGCMPMLLQLPIFFALFRVMNEFKPNKQGEFEGKFGLSSTLIDQGAHAKVLGAPISAAFNSSAKFLTQIGGDATTVKVLAVVLIVTMGLTTFLTQRQMMARNGPATDPQQAQIQKFMLYVLPFSFAIFGFSFPIGVLLYWLTTNVWSMGQQHYVIRRMPVITPGASAAKPAAKAKSEGGASKALPGAVTGVIEADEVRPAPSAPAQRKAPAKGAQAGSRKNKSKKRKRR